MQQGKSTTELFHELLQLNNIDFFIESLIDLLEIKTIIARIPDSVSASQINTLGNKLPVAELIFPIGIDAIFSYGAKIFQKAQFLIDAELDNMGKLADQSSFLKQLEQKIKSAIQIFDWHHPMAFLKDIGFKPINNRNDKLIKYKSSFELDFNEDHYNHINNELFYRKDLIESIYDLVNKELNNLEYDEKRRGTFYWTAESNAELELAEIAFAITCMPQFGPLQVHEENDFVRKFFSLFGLSGKRVAQYRHTLEIRSGDSQLSKYFAEAFRTLEKIENPISTKKK